MANQHIQKSFDQDLKNIQQHIIGMAEMVSQELSDSLQAFEKRDQEDAADTMATDDLINASERIIDNQVVQSVVLHQPMASDCRQLIAALRISKDLERIGDYATNIAKHSISLDKLELTGEEQRVMDMGHAVQTMLQEVIEAYNDKDVKKAELIRQQDEAIDELYTKIFADLLEINSQDASMASACTHLIFVARSLERLGDHITDIAEDVLYIVNGEFAEDNRPKADNSAFIKAGDQVPSS